MPPQNRSAARIQRTRALRQASGGCPVTGDGTYASRLRLGEKKTDQQNASNARYGCACPTRCTTPCTTSCTTLHTPHRAPHRAHHNVIMHDIIYHIVHNIAHHIMHPTCNTVQYSASVPWCATTVQGCQLTRRCSLGDRCPQHGASCHAYGSAPHVLHL